MKRALFIVVFMAGVFLHPSLCMASDEDTFAVSPDMYDYSEIDSVIDEEDNDFDFGETVRLIFNGDAEDGIMAVGKALTDTIWGELKVQEPLLVKIMIIGIISAVFTNISASFMSGCTSQTGFYITFMMLMGVLAGGYASMAEMTSKALDRLISLMDSIVPVYVMSVAFASGSASGAGVYQIITIVMAIIEKIMQKALLPLIYVFMLMNFIDNITDGCFLTKACELLKTLINWVMKALMSFVIGLGIVQGMINPVVDNIKASAFGKAVSVIPGVGGALSSMSGIILGSGTLIKNSIGAAAMLAVVVVCFAPAVRAAAVSIGYKAVGALLEPVSDKRIVNAVGGICDSIVMLSKLLLYSAVFFILTIAIICCTTNHNV